MARIKKGAERKIPISFRLESKTIERLKKIDKFHSKIDVFINKGIDEYEKWLNTNFLEAVIEESKNTEEILSDSVSCMDLFRDDEFRKEYIETLKTLDDYYDNEVFFKLHPEIYEIRKSNNKKVRDMLESWEETKLLLEKDLETIKKISKK